LDSFVSGVHRINGRQGAKTKNSNKKSSPMATVVHRQKDAIREEGEKMPTPKASPLVREVIAMEGPISAMTSAIRCGTSAGAEKIEKAHKKDQLAIV
jgi:hypothetical protein